MANGRLFIVHVTLVAGEPVVVQVKFEEEAEYCRVRSTILGGAGRKQELKSNHAFNLIVQYIFNSNIIPLAFH